MSQGGTILSIAMHPTNPKLQGYSRLRDYTIWLKELAADNGYTPRGLCLSQATTGRGERYWKYHARQRRLAGERLAKKIVDARPTYLVIAGSYLAQIVAGGLRDYTMSDLSYMRRVRGSFTRAPSEHFELGSEQVKYSVTPCFTTFGLARYRRSIFGNFWEDFRECWASELRSKPALKLLTGRPSFEKVDGTYKVPNFDPSGDVIDLVM